MEDEDDNLGPATLSTPLIPVQDVRAEALFVRRSDSAPVDSIVELSDDQAAVSAGASVLIEVYANFVCDSFEGQLFNEPSSALFDFNSEYRIANPGMTITSTPVILF